MVVQSHSSASLWAMLFAMTRAPPPWTLGRLFCRQKKTPPQKPPASRRWQRGEICTTRRAATRGTTAPFLLWWGRQKDISSPFPFLHALSLVFVNPILLRTSYGCDLLFRERGKEFFRLLRSYYYTVQKSTRVRSSVPIIKVEDDSLRRKL